MSPLGLLALSLLLWSTPYPITPDVPGDADFQAMEAKVGAMEQWAAAIELGDDVDDAIAWQRGLMEGRVEQRVVGTYQGLVVEHCEGIVALPLERYLELMPAHRWGPTLADYKGGEVRALGPGRQMERMVLEAPGTDLDMTKIETIRRYCNDAGQLTQVVVTWEVIHSDNGSVIQDIGSVSFIRHANGTRVRFLSGHALATFPFSSRLLPACLRRGLLGWSLTNYFDKAIRHYRHEAELRDRLARRGLIDRLPTPRETGD